MTRFDILETRPSRFRKSIAMQETFKVAREPSIPNFCIATHRFEDENLWTENTKKILVVDDERFNCDIIDGFLMIVGIKNRNEMVEYAYNGEEAVNKINVAISENDPSRYGLILMDCNMPFMDGYTATKKIKKAL